MSFIDIAQSRYSTKKYNKERKVSEEKIQELKEILRLSPSSINSQPWKFTFISNEPLKQKLAVASYFNEVKIKEASHLVVFSAIDSVDYFELHLNKNLPKGAVEYYNTFIKSNPEASIKSWFQHQVYIALGFFLSACASLGIDSTPMEGIENEKYAQILKLNIYKPLFAVCIGYRSADDNNQPVIKPKVRLKVEDIIETF